MAKNSGNDRHRLIAVIDRRGGNREGVSIEALHKELRKRRIHIEMVGIKALDVKEAIVSIERLLHKDQ